MHIKDVVGIALSALLALPVLLVGFKVITWFEERATKRKPGRG